VASALTGINFAQIHAKADPPSNNKIVHIHLQRFGQFLEQIHEQSSLVALNL
jgi:hypothetical protein